jgi:hypothetical protein
MPEGGANCPITGIPLKNGSSRRTSAVITAAPALNGGDLTPHTDRSLSPSPPPITPSSPMQSSPHPAKLTAATIGFVPFSDKAPMTTQSPTHNRSSAPPATVSPAPSPVKKSPPTVALINLPSKCKHIPYQIQRGAGTIAKKVLDPNASGKVLPGGEIVYAISRQLGKDGMPWLHTTVGWIPERLPGQGKFSSHHQTFL